MDATLNLRHSSTGPRLYLARLLEEMDRAAISTRLKASREEAGVTQEEMAEILKVHVRSIQDYERPSLKTVPFDRLDEWAAATGTTKTWLLQGDSAVESDRLAELESRLESVAGALELLERGQAQILDLLRGAAATRRTR